MLPQTAPTDNERHARSLSVLLAQERSRRMSGSTAG